MIDIDKCDGGWEMTTDEDGLFERGMVRFRLILDVPQSELYNSPDPGLALGLLMQRLVVDALSEYQEVQDGQSG